MADIRDIIGSDDTDGEKNGITKMKKKKANGRVAMAQGTIARLSRPPKKNFRVEDLDVSTLRPLVDLAYWSTFLEVRRDAAAAFATLAMNEMNLPVLSEAGALGAVIALIGINNDMNDSHIHRDAATALSYLLTIEDVKKRFLKAPDGLRSIFYICRSPSIEVKRAVVKVFGNLATLPETKEALVANGGVKYLFTLATTNDEKTKRKAAVVLKRLAAHPPNHERICSDENAIRSAISLLLECNDLTIRRDMIEFVLSVASENSRKKTLVDHGILTPLLMHMDPGHSSLETITLVIQCIHSLSACPDVLPLMVEDGMVEALSKVIFQELAEIRTYRALRKAHMLKGSAKQFESKEKGDEAFETGSERDLKKVNRPKTQVELEEDALRFGLSVLHNISSHSGLRDELVERCVPSYLYEDSILESSDKRIRRITAKILVNITNSEGKSTSRHEKLIESGILYPIRVFLRSNDFVLRTQAVKITALLAVSDSGKRELGRYPEIMKLIVSLCNPHDEEVNEWVARTLAELSDLTPNFSPIINAGGLQALIFMISPRSKSKAVREESVRCLSNISTSREIKMKIVASGGLGYLISMSKSGTGLIKMYALATLTNLEHDTAAVRIQMVFRGYISRKMMAKRRAALEQYIREEKESKS